jgi:dihydroorotate dehydrogenase
MGNLYKSIISPVLFRIDPETIHDIVFSAVPALRLLGGVAAARLWAGQVSSHAPVNVAGLSFKNPIGLAAGFDKNALALDLFTALGFGHIEVGTVTIRPQSGNPRPRIFRLPQDQALINRMGFPSDGVEAVLPRLERWRSSNQDRPIIGVNIGKLKDTSLDDAAREYADLFERVAPVADYVAINVSSPNTEQLRDLQQSERLRALLSEVTARNARGVPIFLKLSPDLEAGQLDDVLNVVAQIPVAGVIATNTTLSRDGLSEASAETGGLSGRPLAPRAIRVVRYCRQHLPAEKAVIGAGGVFDRSGYEQMKVAGAVLVQVYTGLIYQGPTLVHDLIANELQTANL